MSYNVKKSDGTVVATIADRSSDSASTSLTLIGSGYLNYGLAIDTNFVRMLENFANTTAPAVPLKGQLWYNTTATNLQVFDGTAWKLVGPDNIFGTLSNFTITVGSSTINALASNGVVVAIASMVAISHTSLPVNVNVNSTLYVVQASFPNGIGVGLTLATSAIPANSDNSNSVASTSFVKAQNYISANQTITISGDITGTGTTAITTTLPATGVTAGTYTKLVVNAKGLITHGSAVAYADIISALGFTPSPIAGTALVTSVNGYTGPVTLHASDITGIASAANPIFTGTMIAQNLFLQSSGTNYINFQSSGGTLAQATIIANGLLTMSTNTNGSNSAILDQYGNITLTGIGAEFGFANESNSGGIYYDGASKNIVFNADNADPGQSVTITGLGELYTSGRIVANGTLTGTAVVSTGGSLIARGTSPSIAFQNVTNVQTGYIQQLSTGQITINPTGSGTLVYVNISAVGGVTASGPLSGSGLVIENGGNRTITLSDTSGIPKASIYHDVIANTLSMGIVGGSGLVTINSNGDIRTTGSIEAQSWIGALNTSGGITSAGAVIATGGILFNETGTDTGLQWISDGVMQVITNSVSRILFGPTSTQIAYGLSGSSGSVLTLQSDGNMVISFNGTALWSSGTVVSDSKLKQNIQPFTGGLDVIKSIDVESYQYKEGFGLDITTQHVGFMADKVQKQIPHAVRNIGGTLHLDKDEIVPYLVGAVQTISKENEALRARVNELERMVKLIMEPKPDA